MLRHTITQRIIVLLDAAVLGFIVDRISHSPLWGILSLILALMAGNLILTYLIRKTSKPEFDKEMYALLISAGLALLFFIECAASALLILA